MAGPNQAWVDRSTKWGNPFLIGRDGTRAEVIAKYDRWITVGAGRHLLAHLGELEGKHLVCWCPRGAPCHRDVLYRLLAERRLGVAPVTDQPRLF